MSMYVNEHVADMIAVFGQPEHCGALLESGNVCGGALTDFDDIKPIEPITIKAHVPTVEAPCWYEEVRESDGEGERQGR